MAEERWIPVTERLPKPNEEDGNGFYKAYLVQDGRWMDVARWDGKYWVAWGYSTVLLNVVAWMPLPIAYREGGQDASFLQALFLSVNGMKDGDKNA